MSRRIVRWTKCHLVKHTRNLRELVHHDFLTSSAIEPQLTGFDARFFCLGVSLGRHGGNWLTGVTFDITLTVAQTLARLIPP